MGNGNGQEQKSDLVKLGPLWVNKARSGQIYLQGYLGDAKMLVLQNNFKEEGSKHPDYFLFVAPKPPKKDGEEKTERREEEPAGQFSVAAQAQRDGHPLDDEAPPPDDGDYNDAPEIS